MAKHPGSAPDLVDQALDLMQRGDELESARLLRAALVLEPEHHRAMALLGMTLIDRDPPAAIELIEQALWLSADTPWYFLALGNAHARAGHDAHAVAAMQKAALMDPSNDAPHYDLARHYLQRGQTEQALTALRRVLAIRADHPQASYLVASLTGHIIETAPAAYVAELFDSYAPSFERHLVDELQYRAPEQLAAMVAADGSDGPGAWHVLDLGCGSGLVGAAFRPLAKHLVGSDLSRRMIEQARQRAIYDELFVEDLRATLDRARGVDLVVAADVFIYVGALEAVFAAAAAALRPGGRFAFSIERHDGDGVVLRPTSRYAHADRYLRDLAARHGFDVRRADDITLRVDRGAGIPGALYLLARAA